MNTFTVGDFKTRFSEVLKRVRPGEEIIISYGKKKETLLFSFPMLPIKPKRFDWGYCKINPSKFMVISE